MVLLLTPEVFVPVVYVALLFTLSVLTVVTQLGPQGIVVLQWLWRAMRWLVPARNAQQPPGPRKPGRRARKTQRRRERLASQKETYPATSTREKECRTPPLVEDAMESAFNLYEQHLSENKRREKQVLCAQLHNLKARTLEFPCRGCGQVNAKKNCNYNCCASCCRDNKNSVCRVHGTGYQAALANVEAAMHHAYIEFDLSYAHLRKCPPNVSFIGPQLISLNLSNNRLTTLPNDIGNLCSLNELFLQYNCLTRLPDSICDLSMLEELDVKNNRLSELPADIGNLKGLLIFSLTNNHIAFLPRSIGRLEVLQELSLHSNHLTELPDEICNLTNLRIIYSGENRLQTLPTRFGQLVNLEELDVSGCELVTLPDSLSQCESLVRLWLSNNRLVSLPPHIGDLQQLKELHVRHNKLKCLPASMQKLHLYTFTAQNNCLIDESTAKSLCRTPRDPLPPLLELAARMVVRHELTWQPGSIPRHLDDMLQHPSRCSRCGGPFFQYFSSSVTFRTVGVFFRVPLYQQFCSPHSNNVCS